MTAPHNIGLVSALVIDDSRFDRRRLERLCEECELDITLRQAATKEEFGTRLDGEKFDVIYVDLNLPEGSGLDLIPIVRAHRVNCDASIIMIAGDNQSDVALNAIRSGCSDYIDKDTLSVASLSRATINAVQKLYLQRSETTAREDSQTVNSILLDFAEECRAEMRPMLTRMLRQIRRLKTTSVSPEDYADSITGLEQTCVRMDEFLGDLSSVAGMPVSSRPETKPIAPVVVAQKAVEPKGPVAPRRAGVFSHR